MCIRDSHKVVGSIFVGGAAYSADPIAYLYVGVDKESRVVVYLPSFSVREPHKTPPEIVSSRDPLTAECSKQRYNMCG